MISQSWHYLGPIGDLSTNLEQLVFILDEITLGAFAPSEILPELV